MDIQGSSKTVWKVFTELKYAAVKMKQSICTTAVHTLSGSHCNNCIHCYYVFLKLNLKSIELKLVGFFPLKYSMFLKEIFGQYEKLKLNTNVFTFKITE